MMMLGRDRQAIANRNGGIDEVCVMYNFLPLVRWFRNGATEEEVCGTISWTGKLR